MPPSRTAASTMIALLLALFATPPSRASSKADITRQIQFGTEMAKDGNWNEAIFRWKRALALDPQNPRIHNNLAVAYESLGDYAKANAEYVAALACPEPPAEVRTNYEQFKNFYGRYKEIVSSPDSHTLEGPKSPGGNAH